MVERRESLGFAFEPRDTFRVSRTRRRQDLDRNFAIQGEIARPIDLAHAARSEVVEDLVAAEACPREQCHGKGSLTQRDEPT